MSSLKVVYKLRQNLGGSKEIISKVGSDGTEMP